MTRLRVQGCALGQASPLNFGDIRTKDSSGSRCDIRVFAHLYLVLPFFLFFLKGRSWTEQNEKQFASSKIEGPPFELRDLESKWPPNLEVTLIQICTEHLRGHAEEERPLFEISL